MPSQTSPGGREHCKGLKGSSLKTMVGCTISLEHLGRIQKVGQKSILLLQAG